MWDAGEQPGPERIEEPEPPAPPRRPRPRSKGATGRAATIRVIKLAKVVDYDKAYAHLKAIPEIKQAIDKVAQRMITAGQRRAGR
jgi:ribosomal protein S26